MVDKPIDLRSDTVTRPTPAMMRCIARAQVGDDVFGEDPTVNRLQEVGAELLGKEASLYVPSGTMANQVAIKAQTSLGDEIIMERTSHPFNYESGALSAISGVQVNLIDGVDGIIAAEQVEAAIRPDDPHYAPTRLVSLENTHNRGGGSIYPLGTIEAIARIARRHKLIMHLDGARLMNACVAAGKKPTEYTRSFDSVTLCLSKGLGAPVGSLIAGSADLIRRCNRFRKMFGGGMRQAGILASAGLYALENHVERLAEDHQNAALLAEGLAELAGIRLDPSKVVTNIVYFETPGKPGKNQELVDRLRQEGVLLLASGPNRVRAVTHLDVNRRMVEQALRILRRVSKQLSPTN